jgi:hypothetical protein
VVEEVVLANSPHVGVDALRGCREQFRSPPLTLADEGGSRYYLFSEVPQGQAAGSDAANDPDPLTSPTPHSNCFSAVLFHFVAACTISASSGLSRPSPALKATGVRLPSRSSVVDVALRRDDEGHLQAADRIRTTTLHLLRLRLSVGSLGVIFTQHRGRAASRAQPSRLPRAWRL